MYGEVELVVLGMCTGGYIVRVSWRVGLCGGEGDEGEGWRVMEALGALALVMVLRQDDVDASSSSLAKTGAVS